MGFFKSMSDLNKQAKEINKTWDPGQQMKDGMARMQEANAMMAQATQAANLALTGTSATASIVSAQQTGALVNFQPSVELELTVFPTGGVPYPVTVEQIVEQIFLGKAVPGANVAVKVDSADPQVVWIDWANS
ncbi:hypothetical protein ABIE44_001829 [Marmoricola sp. OAE513]|uniref:hypothetical protein n=1 Tax=Marmoricola sp. OAE513 TaxID=2817894 RepID=UPI001AE602BB